MDDNTPTRVGHVLPEVIDSLRSKDPQRAQELMRALLSNGPVPCICGCGHPEDNDSDECDA